jgi:tetratricopeptide (TPR) repeat protein
MERSDSHILESESRLKFEAALPRNWVPRKQDPDYGYDYDVQVFHNGTPTPFHFYVQLKSTNDMKIHKEGAPLSFETKYFRLYSQGPFPVMICLYVKSLEKLFYLWVDDYLNKIGLKEYKDINFQKTKTIYLNKEISEIKHMQLEEEIKRLNYIRNPDFQSDDIFNVNLYIGSDTKKNSNIYKKIFLYFYGKYNIGYFKLSESKDIDKANLIIDLKKQNSIIKYDGEILEIPITIEDERSFPSVAVSIGILLFNSGYSKISAEFILEILSNDINELDEKYIYIISIFISKILNKGNKSLNIIELSKLLLKSQKIVAAEMFANSGNFIFSQDIKKDKLYKKEFIDFTESLLTLYKSDKEKGPGYYNMANVLSRSLGECRKAIGYYFKAKKYDPDYVKRSYWWAELGGCFFIINKFKFSEGFYRKSIELKEEIIPSKALMADAILYQGRYSEAAKEFEIYLQEKDYRESDFILKYLLSSFLSRHYKDKPRETEKAMQIAENAITEVIKTDDKKKAMVSFKEAIDLDPLCGLAWYNYAVATSNDKDEERFLEWLITSILQPGDLESWTNAITTMFFEAIMIKDPTLFGSFTSQAVENFGESLFISIENILREQKGLPAKLIEETMEAIKKSFTQISIMYKKEEIDFTFRILDDD